MRCTQCGLEQEAGSRFCLRCGATLPGAQPAPSLDKQRQVETLISRAGLLRARKNLAAAISTCQEALQIDPDHPWAHVLLAELYADAKRLDEALQHLERAAELSPDNPNIQEKLARLRPKVKRRAPEPTPEPAASPPEPVAQEPSAPLEAGPEPEPEVVGAEPPAESTPALPEEPPAPLLTIPEPVAAPPPAAEPVPQPAAVPDAARRWNWGAFLLALFWTPAHRLWNWFGAILALILGNIVVSVACGFLSVIFFPFAILGFVISLLVGVASLVIAIYLGVRGGQLAWRARPFDSVQHFLRVQHAWKTAALIYLAVCVLVFVVLPTIAAVAGGVALFGWLSHLQPAFMQNIERWNQARPPAATEAVPATKPEEAPAPDSSAADRLAIKQVLRSFERALAGKDQDAFLALIDPREPALRASTSGRLSEWLPNAESVSASYRDESIEVTGDRAVVKGEVTTSWTEDNTPKRDRRRFEMRLRKHDGEWLETAWQDTPLETPQPEPPDTSAQRETALRLEGQLANAGSPQEMAQIARAARGLWQEILGRDPNNAEARAHISSMDQIIRASAAAPPPTGR